MVKIKETQFSRKQDANLFGLQTDLKGGHMLLQNSWVQIGLHEQRLIHGDLDGGDTT